jgi:squalene-hopene/tetraprenyl-beta-curcumene cyclase
LPHASSGALDRTVSTLTERLLAARHPSGHWEGRLASSALSTATAIVALSAAGRAGGSDHRALIRAGAAWLAATQNRDGGWGDTDRSASNLSTTALVWSALSSPGEPHATAATAIARAEGWLRGQVGDLSPAPLQAAIIRRYGKDRTFSVPILMVLALAGKLGSGVDAWRRVPQLPFELAACPHEWFRLLRLPVVSYALPALVAIGQVRHHLAPTRNPLLRQVRSGLLERTLRRAREMQPASGGYLEATPLTAFVVMSLIAGGRASHPIVNDGLRFLVASVRPDGSWPIDTNLATWVTTLAINAIGQGDAVDEADRRRVLDWLLA